KIAPYHTLKFGGIGKLAYLCTVVRRKACASRQVNIQHSTFNTINSTFNIKTKDYGSKRNIEIS
ncbi:hypothetical protein, partial [Segatella copri]|uniref:hypothetical protein n=1 Tax=Segatella copri TaxID=165179 RepID=UPI001D17B2D8